MLLAEDLLLLITDDSTGRLSALPGSADVALGGANLIELALMGKVGLTGAAGRKPGRIIVHDPAGTGDQILDAALQILAAQQGRRLAVVVRRRASKLRLALYERLAASGIVRAEQHTILWAFPARRWPVQDVGHRAETCQLVTQALAGLDAPDTKPAVLRRRGRLKPANWRFPGRRRVQWIGYAYAFATIALLPPFFSRSTGTGYSFTTRLPEGSAPPLLDWLMLGAMAFAHRRVGGRLAALALFIAVMRLGRVPL